MLRALRSIDSTPAVVGAAPTLSQLLPWLAGVLYIAVLFYRSILIGLEARSKAMDTKDQGIKALKSALTRVCASGGLDQGASSTTLKHHVLDASTDRPSTRIAVVVTMYAGAKNDVLAVLAKLLGEQGKEIRAAALNTLQIAYEFQGEGGCQHS